VKTPGYNHRMTSPEQEKAREFVQRWADQIDGRKLLLDLLVREGVPFRHPDTGKWHDRSGLGFDSREDLVRYGDMFVFADPQPGFQLR